MTNIFYEINVFLSIYSLLVAGLGTIGNILSIIVCLQKSLRRIPTFIFVAFMLAVDTLSLYIWNFNDYFLTYYGKTIGDMSVEWCKFSLFTQMFSLEASAWLLVTLTIERYLNVRVKSWRIRYFKPLYAVQISVAIILFFILFNSHMLFTVTFSQTNHTSVTGACALSDTHRTWRPVHTYVYSIVPFLILFVTNMMLIYQAISTRNKIESTGMVQMNRRIMTKSIIILTFAFILLTGPFAIAGGYYTSQLMFTQSGRVILFVFIEVAFTFHALNFIILYYSNKLFSKEFKNIVKNIRNSIREQLNPSKTIS